MIKLYKLTNKNGQTFGGTQWGPGVSHSGTGEGGLCGPGWIHAYEHPLVAVLMNPIHADFKNPRLWEAEGEVGLRDGQIKCGCKTLTTIREIPLPEITVEMRVRFTILCAKEVCACRAWNAWADRWLSGEDRSAASAAAMAARAAAAYRAARVAAAAARVAAAAAYRAEWVAEAEAEWVAAWATSTLAAIDAAARAEAACCCMDLAAIAEKACDEKERRMKKGLSVSEAARMMGRAGRGDCKRRNVDYRKLARMAVAARRKKALMKGKEKKGNGSDEFNF